MVLYLHNLVYCICKLIEWICLQAIERAETALRDAERYVSEDGQEALRRAKDAQDQLGRQSDSMTQIAKEARELAEQWVIVIGIVWMINGY